MAEGIVISVLGKLANVVVKEILLLHGVDQQVQRVRRQLGWIQAFLKDADKKKITDDTQKHWVEEVRDLAYSIEDVIDTFLLEFPDEKPRKSGMKEPIKRIIKKTKNLSAIHKLVDDINQIETRMKEIEANRVSYGINNLGEGGGPIRLPVRPILLPDIDPDIVGFEADMNYLVKKLGDENIKRLIMVSIWGVGGLGKTTLTQKIYNCIDVKQIFEVRIWVTISQNFEIIGVINNIVRQLNVTIQQRNKERKAKTNGSTEEDEKLINYVTTKGVEEVVLTEIHTFLSKNKYLLVLDDVWTSNLWTQIGGAFPNKNNGSRVLITTRSYKVGEETTLVCEQYKPAALTKELSRELLLKTTFPDLDTKKDSFDDLSDILGQFIHKCEGLPLALVVLGGLLSNKEPTNDAWSTLFNTMRWHDQGKNCGEILATSYEDLPFALKSCFMYFAAFPEDYEIEAKTLVNMWIAEGFVTQEDGRTLAETAHSFLEELVKRSLVQMNYRSNDGSIEVIHLHDVLLELAINKAKEQKFLMVYSHPSEQKIVSKSRRVAIHNQDCDVQLSENLRTLLCFHNGHMPDCSKLRLLKVVSTGDYNTIVDRQMFQGLQNLKYLRHNWMTRGNELLKRSGSSCSLAKTDLDSDQDSNSVRVDQQVEIVIRELRRIQAFLKDVDKMQITDESRKHWVEEHAGFMTYEGEYYGSQAKISAWGVPNMNPNSRYEVSITLLNLDGDHVRLIKAGFHVCDNL
ncbi:disease resistance protein RPP13-like [Carex rostrata]